MLFSVGAFSQEKPLIEPDVSPVPVDEALIDTENFEIGTFIGVMNIEDFESSALYGLRLAYHLSETFFFEANIGMAEAGETSAEKLGNFIVLSDSERDYLYYSFGVAYNLPGETYVNDDAFNTNFYLSMGIGATDFADDTRLTGSFGAGYQFLVNDWLALHVAAKQHLYKIDLLGEDKMSFNTEFSTGISFFF
jgi:outer membrane beta-barrel protein